MAFDKAEIEALMIAAEQEGEQGFQVGKKFYTCATCARRAAIRILRKKALMNDPVKKAHWEGVRKNRATKRKEARAAAAAAKAKEGVESAVKPAAPVAPAAPKK